ncbi:hypothetical protein LPW11_19920 [Geomonas sp. RF6]|uniref:hypothetical protein n=1 Tax=Geomonas sp. RF6 TaxID=2897342 RepID=UPI001E447C17|nr:hypothetical protein [Geomonas sp. RF6]UFS70129.1 hypothetical protein LPW11_19920 [Geomonas sp. RF6]
MKVSSKLLVFAVSGALTAAAVPALALENEFHGMFQLQFDNSNFNGSNTADATGARYTPEGKDAKAATANFFEQRARLAYIAKANQDVKLVTKFELDYSYWGNSSYTTKRNQGGALGADTVNLETKNVFLDLNSPTLATSAKFGMQPVDDAFKGIFFSADMPGVMLTHDFSKATASVGFFRWNDTSGKVNPFTSLGKDARDMVLFDGKLKVTDTTKLGLAYYFVNSNNVNIMTAADDDAATTAIDESVLNENLTVHTVGLNGETAIGPVTIDGFALYQFGTNYAGNQSFWQTPATADANKHRSAWAANVGARMKVAPNGTLRSEFLYVSGEGNADRGTTNAFYTPATFNYSESGFWNNEMVILGRDKNAFTNDTAIVFDGNNKNEGVFFGSVGYDHTFTDKISGSVNAGFAAAAKANAAKPVNLNTGSQNSSNYLGTEINAEVNYKFAENVTFSTRAGYVFLGDYFKGVAAGGQDPDDPYDVKVLVNYSF